MANKGVQARSLFLAAIEGHAPEQWPAYLDRACGEDRDLRVRVEELLEAHRALGTLPGRPGGGVDATIDAPPGGEALGTLIGPYKLLEVIAEGGMGVVYVAEQVRPVRRKVALKVIKPGMDSKRIIARFEAERQALALMDHPNIAKVLDAGTTDSGRPYFVMELVRGLPITDHCDQAQLSVDDRLNLFILVCQAVQHAHQKGVIHRDIKPSNVMVTLHDGVPVPKVIDFGVAKAMGQALTDKTLYTAFHQFIGTPLYMSPEQAELSGLDIDTRSDIYALGVLLYELLTGTTPFDADRLRQAAFDEVRRIIREDEPPRPSTRLSALGHTLTTVSANRKTDPRHLARALHGDLDWIVLKCLEKDRARRYESANGLATDIRRYLTLEPVTACPPSSRYRLAKFARRNRVALTATGLIMISLVAGTAVSVWQARRATDAQRLAATALVQVKANAAEANRQRTRAEAQRNQAQAIAEERRQRQARLYVEQGGRLLTGGDLAGSLPYFVEALRLDEQDPARARVHRVRLKAILDRCPKPAGIWYDADDARFRPDGRAIAIQSAGSVTVRDVATGRPLGPSVRPVSIPSHGPDGDFSPDGRRLVTRDQKNARIWDVATGQEVVPTIEHPHEVVYTSFSPDGRLLLTAGESRHGNEPVGRVWNAATGKPLTDWFSVLNYSNPAFSPDSRSLVLTDPKAVNPKTTPRLHDARTGQPISPPMSHPGGVMGNSLHGRSFSPDSRKLVTAGEDGVARIWDTASGVEVRLVSPMKHPARALEAVFAPDGRRVLTTSEDTTRVWDAFTGNPLGEPMRHPTRVGRSVFSGDGSLVATTSRDRAVRIWNAATGELALAPILQPSVPPFESGIAFSQDGRYLLSQGTDRTVFLWDLATGTPAGRWAANAQAVAGAVFTPDGRTLITWGQGGAQAWDAATLTRLGGPLVPPTTAIGVVEISPDGRSLLITRGDPPQAWVWDLATRRVRSGPFRYSYQPGEGRSNLTAWGPRGRLVATAAGGYAGYPSTHLVQIWDTDTGASLTPPMPFETVSDLQFSPDGRLLALGCGALWTANQGTVHLLDARTGKPVRPPIRMALADPTILFSPCRSVRFSPDGKTLLTSASKNAVDVGVAQVWDVNTGRPLTPGMEFLLPLAYAVARPVFRPDGRQVLLISSDNTVRLWDAATGKPVLPPMPCGGTVREVAFSPDGRWALTLGDRAQVWDLADGQPITPQLGLDRRLLAEFTPDGRRLFIISGAGDLGFLDFTPDDRPIEDLARLALILSGSRIDASGSAVPVSSSELREAHEALLARHPETFRTSVEQLRNWHLRQAERCEASRFWAGAVEHLNHLIADGPDAGALLIRRGLAHAELENVREAARDLDVHALGPVDGYYVWYRAALLHLADGDLDGYRAACAALLRHFGGPEATGDPAHFASWCCALAPDALVDYAPALALAERALAAQPSDLMAAQTVGALLHRAGRHAEAVERLEQARSLTGGTRSTPIYALLFLAMAHHRLGHAEEARHCLEEAASAIEKATLDHERGTEVLPFQRRLTLKFLRHEVTALLGLAPDTMPSGPDAFAR